MRTWFLASLIAAASGCATAPAEPAVTAAADTDRTINTLRAQNSSYVRQIEELQNRVFILEDRLDSQRVIDLQRSPPSLPVVKALRAEPPAPVRLAPPPPPAPPPSLEAMPGDTAVEYSGEAAQVPPTTRPVLRIGARTPAPVPAPRTPAPRTAVTVRPKVAAVTPPPSAPPRVAPPAAAPRPVSPAVAPHAPMVPVAQVVALTPTVTPTPTPAPPPPSPPPTTTVVAEAPIREGSELREAIPAEPLRIYRDALEALRAGHHAAALAGFRRFLDRYPVHDYADNAQYWIGECYYDLHQYQAATREFRAVIERYPRGNKVPDAMLKLGFAHLALGQPADGRMVLDGLVRAYPRHSSAALATARLSEPPFGSKVDVSLGTIVPRNAGTR